MSDVVCFGELLLRLNAKGHNRLSRLGEFEVYAAGAEANVARGLTCLGTTAAMISTLADNALGEGILSDLASYKVDISNVHLSEGRIGQYFLETGAVKRPSRIIYDRADTAFASASPDSYDWTAIFKGARLFHVSGITPAVGKNPASAALKAVSVARELGLEVSFDGNYREALWKTWSGDGPKILKDILSKSTIAFINERDLGLIFGETFDSRETAIDKAFDTFPDLHCVACTRRDQSTVVNQTLTGELYKRDGVFKSSAHSLEGVVDRIGGGDAFAAGFLHAVLEGYTPQYAIDYATAAGVLKHSVPGDALITKHSEVVEAMESNSFDVRR